MTVRMIYQCGYSLLNVRIRRLSAHGLDDLYEGKLLLVDESLLNCPVSYFYVDWESQLIIIDLD